MASIDSAAETPIVVPMTETRDAAPPLPTDVGALTPGDFQSLLLAVLSPAFGYALRLTRDRADAEDLVQDAALLAYRAAHSFGPGTNFKAWFFQILTRCFWARHWT